MINQHLIESRSYLYPLDGDKTYCSVLLNLVVDGYTHSISVPLPMDGSEHMTDIEIEVGLGYEPISVVQPTPGRPEAKAA